MANLDQISTRHLEITLATAAEVANGHEEEFMSGSIAGNTFARSFGPNAEISAILESVTDFPGYTETPAFILGAVLGVIRSQLDRRGNA